MAGGGLVTRRNPPPNKCQRCEAPRGEIVRFRRDPEGAKPSASWAHVDARDARLDEDFWPGVRVVLVEQLCQRCRGVTS